jgi:predicted RNA-binding protein YlqC (UPF0109 family)
MQDLLEHVARRLVDHPEDVRVTREEREGVIVLRLEVADDDVGKVIGRHGRVARALRTLARASGAKTGERVLVEIGA